VAELSSGFSGALANNEPVFMVLEGPMIMIAAVALTVFHPGFCFGWALSPNQSVNRKELFSLCSPLRPSSLRNLLRLSSLYNLLRLSSLYNLLRLSSLCNLLRLSSWRGVGNNGPDKKDAEHKLEKALSTPSTRNSEERS